MVGRAVNQRNLLLVQDIRHLLRLPKHLIFDQPE